MPYAVAKACPKRVKHASLLLQQALEEEDTKGKGTAATVPFPFDIAVKLNIKHNTEAQHE